MNLKDINAEIKTIWKLLHAVEQKQKPIYKLFNEYEHLSYKLMNTIGDGSRDKNYLKQFQIFKKHKLFNEQNYKEESKKLEDLDKEEATYYVYISKLEKQKNKLQCTCKVHPKGK